VVDGEMMLRDLLAVAWINKGVAYRGLTRIDDAIKCLNTALKIRANVAEAYYNRACYRLLQGQKKAAIADLGKALELKPALKKYAVLDEDFIKIRDDHRFKKLVE
jgi:tetratricopeptide (TPR) repeat protein